ncbi:MAG: hypothetical protein ABSF77_03565 [Spirochaetia bacterium]
MATFETVAQRFALTRSNFVLDPERDYTCFARKDIDINSLAERLRIDLVTDLAPKRLFYGQYGAGKSHTLTVTTKKLEQLTPIQTVRMECPDLSRKARFIDLYREGIMRSLGAEFVLGLFDQVVSSAFTKPKDIRNAFLRSVLGDEELARASSRLIDEEFDRYIFWRWFSGVGVSKADLETLHVNSDLTTAEPARLSAFVTAVGRLTRQFGTKKTLVIVFDEMERLKDLDGDSVGNFITAFTKLADPLQKDVAVIIGYSAAQADDLHELFNLRGPVGSRIGKAATTEIPVLPDKDIENFVVGVIKYLRDEALFPDRFAGAQAEGKDEVMDDNLFPFTRKALQTLKSRLADSLTPRDIELSMTHAAGRAHINDWRVIKSGAIQ